VPKVITMHRIFTIGELVRRIIEEHINTKPALSIADQHKALVQLACVEPFSCSALDILWKDASIRQLRALTGFQDQLVALTVKDGPEVMILQNSSSSTQFPYRRQNQDHQQPPFLALGSTLGRSNESFLYWVSPPMNLYSRLSKNSLFAP
jgi:hypothetical protein